MPEDLLTALSRRVVIADGATGTMLQAHDLSLDDFEGHEGCNEILNVTRPDVVRSLHDAFFAVGVDAVETNTFGANLANLGEYGIEGRIRELARAGAAVAAEAAGDWSTPERLPDTVNSTSLEQEPWLTPDGDALYFMSGRQAPGVGPNGIYVSKKQANGAWGQAEPVAGGDINLPGTVTHCFLAFDLPGEAPAHTFISIRPRVPGGTPSPDIYTTRAVDGVWQPAQRYADRLLDSIANKCRFNVVTHDDLTLGVVSVHDFGKFHTLLFVQYDPKSKEWKGPIVEAPFNDWNIDGACPHFQANGERMIWAAGYDRGPDLISGSANHTGGLYDLYWLPTSELAAYYKARAGVG